MRTDLSLSTLSQLQPDTGNMHAGHNGFAAKFSSVEIREIAKQLLQFIILGFIVNYFA
jgi:flagellar biosynthesis protein FlhB